MGDESAYREEVERLAGWYNENILLLNTSTTKELVIDFRRKKTTVPPLIIKRDYVEQVSNVRFLGVHIEKSLTWSVKKALQRLHFYGCSTESRLTSCLGVWFTSCTAAQRTALQRWYFTC